MVRRKTGMRLDVRENQHCLDQCLRRLLRIRGSLASSRRIYQVRTLLGAVWKSTSMAMTALSKATAMKSDQIAAMVVTANRIRSRTRSGPPMEALLSADPARRHQRRASLDIFQSPKFRHRHTRYRPAIEKTRTLLQQTLRLSSVWTKQISPLCHAASDVVRARKAATDNVHAGAARKLALALPTASVKTRAMGVKDASVGIWVLSSRRRPWTQ